MRWASAVTCTCTSRRPRRRSGTRSTGSAVSSPATTTSPRGWSATRCWPRSAATPASCGGRSTARASRRGSRPRQLAEPGTLLGLLQHDLRANHAPTIEERAGRHHDPADRSLQVHACHGPSRQVDVLREVLVGLLQDDPTLEPRDILVMCPDIETYAPLISAGFGLAPTGPEALDGVGVDGHPAHRLRVKLADRALVSTNPLLAVAGVLLELSGGRVTASEVLDLAATEPCRRRFGFTDDELERAGRWVASTGVRWGLDQDARASFAMDRFPQNTWRTGLDRILLGVAMSGDDHRHLGTGLPLDDVGSNEIDLAGRLAELLDRLDRSLAALGAARSVSDWMDALRTGVRDLTDVPADDAWQFPQLERELARAADDRHRRRRARAAAGRRAGPAGWPPGRPADPGQLPHRHAHRLHDGADALGAAPRRLPARPRRRHLPAGRLRRRRRRARPPPAHGRARRPQRGPPAPPRRGDGRHRAPRHHLHRRQRALRRPPAAGRAAGRAARRRRPHDRRAGERRDPDPAPAAGLRPAQPQGRRPVDRPAGVGRSPSCADRPSGRSASTAPRWRARGRRPAYAVRCRRCSPSTCRCVPARTCRSRTSSGS